MLKLIHLEDNTTSLEFGNGLTLTVSENDQGCVLDIYQGDIHLSTQTTWWDDLNIEELQQA